MSIEAMTWVFGQDIRPSWVKFVLVALADSANNRGTVWPSIKHLTEKTSQDRKTVIAALDELETMGLLVDTGERVGRTAQVKVYRLVGLPTSERHYTYRLTHPTTGEFYVGVRSCDGDPAQDPYMGSGLWPSRADVRPHLTKEILQIHPSRPEAEAHEKQLIRAASADPLCQNRTIPRVAPLNDTAGDVKESRARPGTVPLTEEKSTAGGTRNPKEPLRDPLEEPIGAASTGSTLALTPPPIGDAKPKRKGGLNGHAIGFDVDGKRFTGITADDRLQWQEAYHLISVPDELARLEVWLTQNWRRQNVGKFIVRNLARAQDREGRKQESRELRR